MDALTHLLSAYFYPYWDEAEYATWEEAVDDFVRRSPDLALRAPDEIDALLEAVPDDAALATKTKALGSDYSPPEGDRAWLLAVRDRLRASPGA